MMRRHDGRWALVTGASAGIGEALAHVFAAHGHNVVLSARREERLAAVAARLTERHRVDTAVVAADLADPEAPAHVAAEVERLGIAIDALANNAGFGSRGAFLERPWEEHAGMLQVLVRAPVELTHRFLPGMVARGRGHVLNVASVAGLVPGMPRRTLYGPAKSLIVRFSEALAAEHRADGVKVTALCPGFTYSEFHDHTGTKSKVRALPSAMWMSAEDVAREGYAALMRGQVVCVNGPVNRAITALVRLGPQAALRRILQDRA